MESISWRGLFPYLRIFAHFRRCVFKGGAPTIDRRPEANTRDIDTHKKNLHRFQWPKRGLVHFSRVANAVELGKVVVIDRQPRPP